jgi:dUTP pyrophosphatase
MSQNKIPTYEVRIVRLPHCANLAADLPLPAYEGAYAADLDLMAALPADTPVVIAPGGRAAIPTGLVFALPPGLEMQIRSITGLVLRFGVTVLNAPLPADYHGEVHVILANFGDEPFAVERGRRIAQLVLTPTVRASIREVEVANLTEQEVSND